MLSAASEQELYGKYSVECRSKSINLSTANEKEVIKVLQYTQNMH